MNILSNQKVIAAIKIGVFALLLWFIIDQLFFKNDIKTQYFFFLNNIHAHNVYLLFIALILMPINWLLETYKWKFLIQAKSSWTDLLKSILAGITFGFITPARSGEFVGRVLFLKEEDKIKVFYLSSIGGIAQTIATLLVGVFLVLQWNSNPFLFSLLVGLTVVFLFFYFRFDLFNTFISGFRVLERNNLVLLNEHLPSANTQITVLLLSLIRYGVYLLQYVLVLYFLGVNSSFYMLLIYSGVFLVAQTASPFMPFFDISYRGGTALYIFKEISTNQLAIVSAVTLVWFVNLVVPALVGYWFIWRSKREYKA